VVCLLSKYSVYYTRFVTANSKCTGSGSWTCIDTDKVQISGSKINTSWRITTQCSRTPRWLIN